MTPVEPSVAEGSHLVIYAEDQPEYIPLPAAVDIDGVVTTEWEPDADELQALLCGGRIRLCVHTFKRPLQPVSLDVLPPECGMRES